MTFKKNDLKDGKPDWSLFPFDGAELVVRVLEHGAAKYARDNWRQGADDPEAQRRIMSAIIRHWSALQRGETVDPESGMSHVGHMACNALFLCAFTAQYTDGRPAPEPEVTHSTYSHLTDDPTAVEDITGCPVGGCSERRDALRSALRILDEAWSTAAEDDTARQAALAAETLATYLREMGEMGEEE